MLMLIQSVKQSLLLVKVNVQSIQNHGRNLQSLMKFKCIISSIFLWVCLHIIVVKNFEQILLASYC